MSRDGAVLKRQPGVGASLPENQWAADCFYEHLEDLIESEKETLPTLDGEEIRSVYLMVWLATTAPAGSA